MSDKLSREIKEYFPGDRLGIIGSDDLCKSIFTALMKKKDDPVLPEIAGVADPDETSEIILLAKQHGIFATTDAMKLFELEELDMLLTQSCAKRNTVAILPYKPDRVKMLDHFDMLLVRDLFQIEEKKNQLQKQLSKFKDETGDISCHFTRFVDELLEIIRERNGYLKTIRKELEAGERAMAQIIQGSTIPTFVINRNHIVTHWNKAMEKLSGYSAGEIIGTSHQWKPFWDNERPSMADVILDQIPEDEIQKLYGKKWDKSALIPEAYEAEVFFPKLGDSGKWCYFTAAPIKAPDGRIIGAIETLWDKTQDKKAEEDRERHNRQLSVLCSIYQALGSSLRLEEGLHDAVRELFGYLSVDSFCVFILEEDGNFSLKYSYGKESGLCEAESLLDKSNIIYQAVQNREVLLYEDLTGRQHDSIRKWIKEELKSLSLIPLINKKKEIFGVIQIGSKTSRYFTNEQKSVLSLIGNRIGASIENYRLYERYRKSEKKYRSLFDSDPNPIFIIDSATFEIMDVNQRAQECYGYSQEEMRGMSFWDIGEKNDEELIKGLHHITHNRSLLFSKKRHFKKGGDPFFVNIHVSHSEYNGKDVLIATTADITESVEKETQLIQANKMATLGLMAAGMAHEINQPLNVIQVSSDTLLKMIHKGGIPSEEDLKGIAADISMNVQRASGIIKHMRDFSRRSEGVRSKVNINAAIQNVFKVLGYQLKMHRVERVLDLDPNLPDILAESNRLEQVFINLITNAVDAMDEKEKQSGSRNNEKTLTIRSVVENDVVTVAIRDTGTGMTPEVMEKIYEPFFTTKEVGKGTGLGFSISYGIIRDYNGTIHLASQVGLGTTVEVRFPAAA